MSAYSIATRGLAGRKIPQGVLAAINTLLFGSGEQGAWYDPADLSTLFQDSAGTTPVTAVEQPVGLMLDKSGRGNHASQATSTKRPKYSRRVNLLNKTEQFDDAVWVKDAGLVTPAAYTSPAGQVFTKYTPDTNAVTNHRVRQAVTVPAGVSHTLSFDVKAAGYTGIKLRATNAWVNFDLTTGSVRNSLNVTSPTITALGDGVYRVSATFSIGASIVYVYVDPYNTSNADSSLFAGDGTSGIYISAFDLRLATDAHLPYQWVNTATDYDADPAKFPGYLRFDGIDDAMVTGNIDFTGTDKMTVWAGITKLSDAGMQMIAELSTNAGVTSGSFWFLGGDNTTGAPGWGGRSGGTTRPLMYGVDSAAPINSVLVLASDISGAVSSLRSNGALKATATGTHGTGSFASAPLFVGSRAGTSLFFNGRIYSLIVRGAKSSLSQIEATELYIKRKMRLP